MPPVTEVTETASEAIRKELLKIANANGGVLSPQKVVDKARNKKSVLHKYFEWDAEAAHEQYLLAQARTLIKRVEFEIVKEDKGAKRVDVVVTKQFFSRPSMRHKDGGYETIEAIMSADDKREELLTLAFKELQSFKRKYSALKELAPLFTAIDKVMTRRKTA